MKKMIKRWQGVVLVLAVFVSFGIFDKAQADSHSFISKWDTAKISSGSSNDNQIKLPLESTGTYNFTVQWGDGTSNAITAYNQSEVTHTYDLKGVYAITIDGVIQGFRFNYSGDATKIIEIAQWGELKWGNAGQYFGGTSNMNITAADVPNLDGTINMESAFMGSGVSTVPNMDQWDMSHVTNMKAMFSASSFNQSIGNWDVSNVTDMSFMFSSTFNQPIGSWNVSKVTNMESMFSMARDFNQPIGNWNVSNVGNMSYMFSGAYSFNQPIENWNVSNVYNMAYMFTGAYSFNQPIDKWNISNVTSMEGMFNDLNIMSDENYDKLLISWANLPSLRSYVEFGAGILQYSSGAPTLARQKLIDQYHWKIIDGGIFIPNEVPDPIWSSTINYNDLEASKNHLVVITHGTCGSSNNKWVNDLKGGIYDNTPPEFTAIRLYDWADDAGANAAWGCDVGREAIGAYGDAARHGHYLAKQIETQVDGRMADNPYAGPTYIHLIAHSAGVNLIQTATEDLATYYAGEAVKPIVHLTFLDAFVPNPLDQDKFGQLHGLFGFSEQYVDTRPVNWTNGVIDWTNLYLPNAVNFDITYLDGDQDKVHEWPYEFYKSSIFETAYASSNGTNEFKIGFPFSLESNTYINGSDDSIRSHSGDWCIVTNVADPYRRCFDEKKVEERDVILTDPDQPAPTITGSGTLVDVSQFIGPMGEDNNEWGGELPEITMSASGAVVEIPMHTTVTSDVSGWNGIFSAPNTRAISSSDVFNIDEKTVGEIGKYTSGYNAIDLGIFDQGMHFDQAVKITFSETSKMKNVVYSNFGNNYYTIPDCKDGQVLGQDLNGGACKMRNSNGDFVVWTMHFTTFMVYIPADITLPITTLSTSGIQGSDGWFISNVQVTLDSKDEDGGSGVEKIEYSLDGGTNWITYTDSFIISSEGAHEIKFRSTDNTGNVEDIKSLVINIASTTPGVDAAAPIIESLEMSPDKVNTSDGEQKVLVTVHMKDDATGVNNAYFNFTSPSGSNNRSAGFSFNQYDGTYTVNSYSYPYESKNALISGTGSEGVFQIELVLPQYSEAGIWKLSNISVSDKNNNYSGYSSWNNFEGLNMANIETEILNEATVFDASAPTIESLEMSPIKVNTTDVEQKVLITMHVKDNLVGINNAYLNFTSPSGNSNRSAGFSLNQYDGTYMVSNYSSLYPNEPKNALVSGTGTDGVFQMELILPQYSEAGIWKLSSISVADKIDNYGGYMSWNGFGGLNIPTEINNEATIFDSGAPTLESLEFLPATLDVSMGNKKVIVRMHLKDDTTGVNSAYLSFTSPSGSSNLMAGFYFNEFTGEYPINSMTYPYEQTNALISGSGVDGIFEAELIFPPSSEIGDWKLSSISISDKINNNRYYSQWDNFGGLDIPTTINSGVQGGGADFYPPITGIEDIQGTAGDNEWYTSDLSLNFDVSDLPASSISNIERTEYRMDSQSDWSVYDGNSLQVSLEGMHILYYRSVDKAGNIEEVKEFQFKIDKTAPQISVVAPVGNETYLLNENVTSDWNVIDETSGIESQSGTLEKGEKIDSSSVGEKTFTVTATDKAGNSITKTIKYNVIYAFGGFQNPVTKDGKSFNGSSTIPVKFQLTDIAGGYISNAVASLEVDGKSAVASGDSNAGNVFRYDEFANQYIFNLSVKNTSLVAGTHNLKIELDDGTTHNQDVVIK